MIERLFALETLGIKLGLGNISCLCTALGHPESTFEAIHVAGTNGKGSVTAMVHAALVAAGFRAARYTSPHLADLTERFVIGTEQVSRRALQEVAATVLDRADDLQATGLLPVAPTFFEATTAIAFELFRRSRVEVAVIEVGMGGRYDSTNVLPASVGAITSIGLDHERYLGDTIEAIAAEKAGIIKPHMDVVVGDLPEQALGVIAKAARECGARLIEASRDARMEVDSRDGVDLVTIDTAEDSYGPLVPALAGVHQVHNALVAIRVLEAARLRGIHVPREAIERGLTTAQWPGRLELIDVTGGGRLLLDAAHNPDGARALAAFLRVRYPERPTLVIGAMRDKDVDGIISALLPEISSVITTAAGNPRALPAGELAARVMATGTSIPVRVEADPVAAVELALTAGRTVCVAGSIFVVGAVRDHFKRRAILR